MKKVTSVLLIAFLLFSIVGCTNENNAKWEGYDKMSFKEYLKKGVEGMMKESSTKVSVEVTTKDGWSSAEDLDESDLSEGCKAITYTAKVTADGEKVEYHFFMELDKQLKVRGACSEELDWETTLTESEAEEALEELEEFVD